MTQPTDGPDPLAMRVSDAERERVAEILRQAAGDGRLDVDELGERLATAYAAKTVGDLAPVTADLPAGRAPARLGDQTPAPATRSRVPDRVVAGGPERARLVAVMGGHERKGDWIVPQETTVVCFWGGADLDLRDARFASREVVINVTALMGGCQITVDEDTEVVMEGVGIMGGFSGPSSIVPADDDTVTVRVRGYAVMGGVSVSRKPPEIDGGRKRKRLH